MAASARYTRSLLRALLKLDRRNRYVLFLRDGKAADQFAQYPNVVPVVLATKRRMLFDQVFVPWAARKHRCDVIMNLKHSVPLLTSARTVLVMHGADWIAFPQNYYFLDRLYHGVSLPVFCRKADRIVSVSKDAAEVAIRHLKLPRSKLATIYHGCRSEFMPVDDPVRRQAVRERYRLPERFILYVGRIYPMKNVGGLIEAFAQLRDRIPHDLVLSGIKYYKTEKDLAGIERHGLQDRVKLTGFVEESDLPVIYNLADAFVLPSLYEGFGIPLLEAMACGCPIVTSTAGSCPEVAGDAAELVNPQDPRDIARGIEKVLSNGAYAKELRARGRKRVAHFSWDKSARETLALLEAMEAEGTRR